MKNGDIVFQILNRGTSLRWRENDVLWPALVLLDDQLPARVVLEVVRLEHLRVEERLQVLGGDKNKSNGWTSFKHLNK